MRSRSDRPTGALDGSPAGSLQGRLHPNANAEAQGFGIGVGSYQHNNGSAMAISSVDRDGAAIGLGKQLSLALSNLGSVAIVRRIPTGTMPAHLGAKKRCG